jgi:hypothetical protein
MKKNNNFKTWNYFNKYITKHERPLTQNNPYPLRSLTKFSVFCNIKKVKWKAKKIILTIKKGAMCKKLTSFEILSVWW